MGRNTHVGYLANKMATGNVFAMRAQHETQKQLGPTWPRKNSKSSFAHKVMTCGFLLAQKYKNENGTLPRSTAFILQALTRQQRIKLPADDTHSFGSAFQEET